MLWIYDMPTDDSADRSRGLRFPSLTVAAAAALVLFLILLFGAKLGPHRPADFLRDPAALFGFNPFFGLVSHLGILALVGSSVICLFAARHGRKDGSLLASIGIFGLVIAADDLFLLHEEIWPNWVGLPEKLVLSTYALAAFLIALRFRGQISGSDRGGLVLALSLLAASIVSDQILSHGQHGYMVEDGFKFIGLIVWSHYWIDRAGQAVGNR